MYLVFVRHGESVWNKENRFTGWTDVELSEKGIDEAVNAGMMLATTHIQFDVAYTSVLKRANDTLKYIMNYVTVPRVIRDYHLNERHYGALQGLNKDEMKEKYGEEQVHIWRRSYDVRPPLLDENDKRNPKFDDKYKGIDNLPLAESLKDTLDRALVLWNSDIKKRLLNNENILIVAHGNSIRALIKNLEGISDEDITSLEIPTGKPVVYELDSELKIISKNEL